jgi:hypothetical protein
VWQSPNLENLRRAAFNSFGICNLQLIDTYRVFLAGVFRNCFFQVISIVFSEQFTSAKDPEISRSLEAKIHPL